MDISEISSFVQHTAIDSGVKFTLNGEPVTPKDLGDPNALLPLVVVSANHINAEISGIRSSHLDFIERAEPESHLLGWKLKQLPHIVDGAMLLMINHAIRTTLAQPPAPFLQNPFLPGAYEPASESELRPHLEAFGFMEKAPTRQLLPSEATAPSY
ncbi:hypothetical protein [Paracidovorax wautersii]|uniref:Uncharacterized protein n=1 Tax=Paracidovorax wautersii TaxID=1177982 RepID=A0A1I2HV22_9BURK|nr:hypothetical protein [Paracidovorax wautersii]SFF33253.1 hypothetical protein SAMN04489711_1345 [Paracidovorax wautersii]